MSRKIESALTLQLALNPFFKELGLPPLTTNISNNRVYLQGPCGQIICTVMFTGTNKLMASEYEIIYEEIISFVNSKLEILLELFKLKQQAEEGTKLKALTNFQFNAQTKEYSINLHYSHPLHSPLIGWITAEGKVYFNGISGKSIEDLENTLVKCKEVYKVQKELLDKILENQKVEERIKEIQTTLSGCSL